MTSSNNMFGTWLQNVSQASIPDEAKFKLTFAYQEALWICFSEMICSIYFIEIIYLV